MKAESNIMPAEPFEIEQLGEVCNIRFFQNVETADPVEEDENVKYSYDEYLLTKVRYRNNLQQQVSSSYQSWLELAIKKENEPKPKTDKEKILRLEKENNTLGIELSEKEIEGIIQGMQISDLEIQILQLQSQGGTV